MKVKVAGGGGDLNVHERCGRGTAAKFTTRVELLVGIA